MDTLFKRAVDRQHAAEAQMRLQAASTFQTLACGLLDAGHQPPPWISGCSRTSRRSRPLFTGARRSRRCGCWWSPTASAVAPSAPCCWRRDIRAFSAGGRADAGAGAVLLALPCRRGYPREENLDKILVSNLALDSREVEQMGQHPHGHAAPAAEGWPAWEPAAVNDDAPMNPPEAPEQQPQNNVIQMQQPMQHPQQPQDAIDIEFSGSSMKFFRASCLDIPIELSADSEDDSSPFSNVTSPLLVAELRQRTANSLCAQQQLYNTNDIPPGFTLRGTFAEGAGSSKQHQQVRAPTLYKPIIIDASLFAPQRETTTITGLEIMPWRSADALALQSYAKLVERQSKGGQVTDSQQEQHSSRSSGVTSGPIFEFEGTDSQPSPIKRSISGAPKPKRRIMSLPTAASKQWPLTPEVETQVRRSLRKQKAKKGYKFKHVWLDKNPTKKQKITDLQLGDDGPIQTDTLRAWGIQ